MLDSVSKGLFYSSDYEGLIWLRKPPNAHHFPYISWFEVLIIEMIQNITNMKPVGKHVNSPNIPTI